MNTGMKMLIATNAAKGDRPDKRYSGGERTGERAEMNGDRNGYGSMNGGYNNMNTGYNNMNGAGMERGRSEMRPDTRRGYSEMREDEDDIDARFRDRAGREHYDNGRYAPMRNEGGAMNRMGEDGPEAQRRIGFASNEDNIMPFSQLTAEKWVRNLKNDDGTTGPHWTIDQAKQVMASREINLDPWEFFAALNAMYSDYGKVFKRYGVGEKLDFYVDMAKAFIEDKDAFPDKLARYFQYIVKH